MRPVRQEIDRLLRRGGDGDNPKRQGMDRPLVDPRDGWLTLLDVENVEPTNNASERTLRPAVIWRKRSCGTQNDQGSRFVETIRTVVTG
ncbi:MAG: transposase [Pirellulales bacterium]